MLVMSRSQRLVTDEFAGKNGFDRISGGGGLEAVTAAATKRQRLFASATNAKIDQDDVRKSDESTNRLHNHGSSDHPIAQSDHDGTDGEAVKDNEQFRDSNKMNDAVVRKATSSSGDVSAHDVELHDGRHYDVVTRTPIIQPFGSNARSLGDATTASSEQHSEKAMEQRAERRTEAAEDDVSNKPSSSSSPPPSSVVHQSRRPRVAQDGDHTRSSSSKMKDNHAILPRPTQPSSSASSKGQEYGNQLAHGSEHANRRPTEPPPSSDLRFKSTNSGTIHFRGGGATTAAATTQPPRRRSQSQSDSTKLADHLFSSSARLRNPPFGGGDDDDDDKSMAKEKMYGNVIVEQERFPSSSHVWRPNGSMDSSHAYGDEKRRSTSPSVGSNGLVALLRRSSTATSTSNSGGGGGEFESKAKSHAWSMSNVNPTANGLTVTRTNSQSPAHDGRLAARRRPSSESIEGRTRNEDRDRLLSAPARLTDEDHDQLEAIYDGARFLTQFAVQTGQSGVLPSHEHWQDANGALRAVMRHFDELHRIWSTYSGFSSSSPARPVHRLVDGGVGSPVSTEDGQQMDVEAHGARSHSLPFKILHGGGGLGGNGKGQSPTTSGLRGREDERVALPRIRTQDDVTAPHPSTRDGGSASWPQKPNGGSPMLVDRPPFDVRPSHVRATSWQQQQQQQQHASSLPIDIRRTAPYVPSQAPPSSLPAYHHPAYHQPYQEPRSAAAHHPSASWQHSSASPNEPPGSHRYPLTSTLGKPAAHTSSTPTGYYSGYAAMTARHEELPHHHFHHPHHYDRRAPLPPPSMHHQPYHRQYEAAGSMTTKTTVHGAMNSSSGGGGHVSMAYESDEMRPTKYRKRSRAPGPGQCISCGATDTPEWRRGPNGARTLCNACGLHYSKLIRRKRQEEKHENVMVTIEDLRQSLKLPSI